MPVACAPAACLQEQDVKKMARSIALDVDCAQFCRVTGGNDVALERGGERNLSGLCDMCGDECGKHLVQHCQACAEACRPGAAECRQMENLGGSARRAGTGTAAGAR